MASVLLFDFFGTLVEAPRQLSDVAFPQSHRYLSSLGAELSYDEYFAQWSEVSDRFDVSARGDHVEYSMTELAYAFLTDCLKKEPTVEAIEAYVDLFLAEWNSAIRAIDGAASVLALLAKRYRLAVVSNTNDQRLVPAHLEHLGIAEHFDVVVLSVEHGRRKPHPSIYEAALDSLGASAEEAAFVGDSLEADYLGPRAIGIDAWLIDPGEAHDIDPSRRISSVLDLPMRLRTQEGD